MNDAKIAARVGKYTLEHSIIPGAFGEPQDFFQITWTDERGMKFHKPIIAPIRLKKTNLIFEPPRPYTKKEYKDLLTKSLPDEVESV